MCFANGGKKAMMKVFECPSRMSLVVRFAMNRMMVVFVDEILVFVSEMLYNADSISMENFANRFL